MYLSHTQIEEIAKVLIDDFDKFFYDDNDEPRKMPKPTPIDQFAEEYLGLEVSFRRLSSDGSLCGITAYSDTEYISEESGETITIPLKQNQVLLDSSFSDPSQVRKLCGKRRFTLAHECAHQVLFQMESDEGKLACRKQYSERRAYSLRDLKTREDWNEWQANALGAAILLPQSELDFAVWRFAQDRILTNYEGYYTREDKLSLNLMCDYFKVSKSAMVIRMRKLGYLVDRPYSEFPEQMLVRV